MNSVAFVLLAPVLLLVLFGSLEGGRVLSAWLVITNEAREAARYGAVNYGREDVSLATLVRDHLDERLRGVLDERGLSPATSVLVTAEESPHVVVTVAYEVDLVVPVVRDVLPNPFPLVAQSTMRGE
ncbi:MAG: pilus assembly protein [Chloroflexi bacterium]|nr:pilus assembly protein [Chloroflexota bacterium]